MFQVWCLTLKAVKGETNMTPALVEICDLVCKRGTRLTWKEFRINVKPDGNCFCLSPHELPINRNTIYFNESEDLRLKNLLAGGHHVPGIGFTGDSSYSSPGLLLLSWKVWYVLRKFSIGKQKSVLESIILVFQKEFPFWKYWTHQGNDQYLYWWNELFIVYLEYDSNDHSFSVTRIMHLGRQNYSVQLR